MLVEILSGVAAGFESGGISGAAFAIPPATLAAMGRVPGLVFNLNAVAFAFSVGLFLLTTPILVVTALQCITSLSAVGPVRKTLSILLVLVLWWAVPLLATILLGLLWTALGILVICFIILLPLILNFVFLYYFLPAAHEFREEQRAAAASATEPPDDISFAELGLALLAAACSLVTVAPIVVLATVLKSPLVFVGVMVRRASPAHTLTTTTLAITG